MSLVVNRRVMVVSQEKFDAAIPLLRQKAAEYGKDFSFLLDPSEDLARVSITEVSRDLCLSEAKLKVLEYCLKLLVDVNNRSVPGDSSGATGPDAEMKVVSKTPTVMDEIVSTLKRLVDKNGEALIFEDCVIETVLQSYFAVEFFFFTKKSD